MILIQAEQCNSIEQVVSTQTEGEEQPMDVDGTGANNDMDGNNNVVSGKDAFHPQAPLQLIKYQINRNFIHND